jgi:hypothetical protein
MRSWCGFAWLLRFVTAALVAALACSGCADNPLCESQLTPVNLSTARAEPPNKRIATRDVQR